MKNIYMIFIITIASYSSYGQTNTFPASGNVGIGITNPTEALNINGNIKTGATANNYLQIGGGTAGTGGYFQGTKQSGIDAGYGTWVNHNAYWNGTNWIQPRGSLSSYLYSSNNHLGFVWKHAVAGGVNDGIIIPIELMRLNSLGKLGIGTGGTISAKLHIIGTTEQLRLGYDASSYTAFTTSPTGDLTVAAYGTNPNITLKSGGTGGILLGGNVGIGTTDTKGYKLAVAGNMIAESVKVKLVGTWPDYVFKPSYQLPSLQETEKQIQEIGHLPDIPSATEVKAKGVDLGEMNAKLLKKVEELTLYLIEQQKKNEQQDAHIAALEKKLSVLHTVN